MQVSVNDIVDEAAALLNDPTQKMYTDTILLPYVKRAFQDLQLQLHLEQVQVLNEISTVQTVNAGAVTYPSLPSDLIQPSKMEERAAGSSNSFTPMYEKQWEPNTTPGTELRYWTWREQAINFIGATVSREVKLYYLKQLTAIVDVNSIIPVNFCQPFMASRTAYYAAAFAGENPTKAKMLKDDADEAFEKLLTMEANRRQSMPVRRIPASRSINRGFIR